MDRRQAIPLGLAAGVCLFFAACSSNPSGGAAPAAAATPTQQTGQQAGGRAGRGGRGGGGAADEAPRPYAEVIPSDAVTSEGLFKTHMVGDDLFFEIPRSELNKDILMLTRTIDGPNAGSRGDAVIVFELDEDRIFIRTKSYGIRAQQTSNIAEAVNALTRGPIIAALPVASWGPDQAPVIDVTRLFTTNVPEFAVVNSPQSDRTFIHKAVAFPQNVNVEATQTGNAPAAAADAGGGRGGRGGGGSGVISSRIMWSLFKLPEDQMMPRLHDDRVGVGSISYIDYSLPDHKARTVQYIRRFRLEKQNPNAEVSDPIKPIVYWVDHATPEWLKPYVKAGIEEWQPAYEAAGFSNAIIGMYAPSPEEDPDWSMYDARHSMIYWVPSETQNANGGQVEDPRTGEILKGEVNIYHNVQNLVRNWYFTQVGPLDARAQSLPFPDSLMGRLVEYVVAHEVGHSIGYPHNMKASAMYPADSVRSASFLRRMGGHVATLMDYSRFNYVAQPEDNIPVELLIPGVGPYDFFAVSWAHKPIPGAKTPEEEWPTLDQWSRQQDTIPWFRYTTSDAPNDPYDQTEAVGDQDAVKSSGLGMRNLKRVADMLMDVAEKPGEDYSLLDELYGNVISQWGRYNNHVASIVGGAYTQEKYGTGRRFEPVEKARQHEAVDYLNNTAFQVPDFILDDEIIFRVQAEGTVGRISNAQAGVVRSLLNDSRLNRLIEYEALQPQGQSYTVSDLLDDMHTGIWGELAQNPVRIDVYRRNLQRSYVETVGNHIRPPPPAADAAPAGGGRGGRGGAAPSFPSDSRALLRGHLVELDREIEGAIARAADGVTRLHLRDLRVEIESLLRPPE